MKGPGRYTKEFKLEAIRLLETGDKPASEIAMELGIKRTLLYRWRDQAKKNGDLVFSGRAGRPKDTQLNEISKLKKELKDVTEERDILKKAAAYFARDLK
jgi:transposase